MAEAIYRKYRPTLFSEVTGQEHVTRTIQNQIKNDQVAHAYLFSGPRGVGKTTIARLLAKAVNCTDKNGGEPCNTCSNCEQMNAGSAMDIIEIDAASHTGVDNVRDNIIEAVRFGPSQGKYKVFIIDEVHMLSTSAFNALLKTLEEPPAHAMFILATTEIHKIPQTILSRCQRFNFHRIPADEMILRLNGFAEKEGVKVDEEVMKTVSRLSEGCLRDAESLFGQLLALGEEHITEEVASLILPKTHISTVVEIVEHLYKANAAGAINALNAFVHEGGSVRSLQDEMIELIRTVMMTSLSDGYGSTYDDQVAKEIKTWAAEKSPGIHAGLLDLVLKVRQNPAHESVAQLPLEIAFVQYCHRSQGTGTIVSGETTTPPHSPPANPVGLVKTEEEEPAIAETSEKDELEEKKPKKPIVPTDAFAKDVQEKWGRCCDEVKKKSVALPLAMHGAVPLSYSEGVLKIGFHMKFHYENMSQMKNAKMMQDAINVVMQTDIKVESVYTKAEEDRVVGQLVDAFGGQVV